jgi:hypothetical protein
LVIARLAGAVSGEAGMSTVEYAIGTIAAAAFAAVLYKVVTSDRLALPERRGKTCILGRTMAGSRGKNPGRRRSARCAGMALPRGNEDPGNSDLRWWLIGHLIE